MAPKIRIGVLISGSGTNLQAIIDACEQGQINGQVVVVGSDRPSASGLQRAQQHHIPIFVVDYASIVRQYRARPEKMLLPAKVELSDLMDKQHLFDPQSDPEKGADFLATRVLAESRLLSQLNAHKLDLLVLAGFMRNLTPYFIDTFNIEPHRPRIMNIHPALLPAFPGVDGYGDTFHYGCKVAGCTVHFIDYGEDSGPIIAQRCCAILPEDTLETVREKGLALEWQVYPECIELFARDRLQVVTMTYTRGNGDILQRRVVQIVQD